MKTYFPEDSSIKALLVKHFKEITEKTNYWNLFSIKWKNNSIGFFSLSSFDSWSLKDFSKHPADPSFAFPCQRKMVKMEMVEMKMVEMEMVGASIAGPPREQHHLPPVSFHCLHNWELLSAVKEGFAERQNTNSKQLWYIFFKGAFCWCFLLVIGQLRNPEVLKYTLLTNLKILASD